MSSEEFVSQNAGVKFNYKSISCENIPELFLDKLIAKKHFSRFGRINKFILRPNRLQCTVDYEREDEANNACLNAGLFNGIQFDIKFTELEDTQVRNTEEWIDSDVQAELNAMSNNISSKNFSQKLLSPSLAVQIPSQKPTFGLKVSQPKLPKPILKTKPAESNQQKIDITVRNELEIILRRPASNAEEQYKILDARDKLIRLKTIRNTDINKVVSTQGICPDMCPEKERLLRETRNQVAIFELNSKNNISMDYKLAIKEYSRSSADQETPLSHELRPENVLKMTMQYLMQKIMPLCDNNEVNMADWYHFVWDRTRSIRKDITQQDLCSLGSVELLEQCTRFHIHCAARLLAEDLTVFDARINTENLTKCLQTLKYMYHDLRLKNIKCPNEAEFRGYIVLLNLHDSNFLWEIKQLPNELQKSTEIQKTVEFYLAMESNNYVKFFRLIRKTTYMNACILLRYFNQVRFRALQTIVKAYNWPRQAVSLTLKYLKEILAFESEESTVAFFNHYGLECDTEKVILNRTSLYIPDEPFLMDRAINVIEMKRTVSVGEAICGGALQSLNAFDNHEPHCSFDENGYLMPEAWTAEDQITEKRSGRLKINMPKRTEDNNVFKVPSASPPISPKQQLMKSSIFSQSALTNQQHEPFKNVSLFQQNDQKALFKSSPSVGDQALSIFNTNESGIQSSVLNSRQSPFFKTNSLDQDSGSLFRKTEINKKPTISESIFACSNKIEKPQSNQFSSNTNLAPSNLLPKLNNIFQSNLTAIPPKKDNIFKNFNESPISSIFSSPPIKSNNTITTNFVTSQADKVNFFANDEKEQQNLTRKIQEEKQKLDEALLLEQERIKAAEQMKAKLEEDRKQAEKEIAIRQQQEAVRIETEKQKKLDHYSEEFYKKLLDEVESEYVADIANMELTKFFRISDMLTNQILDEVLNTSIHKLCMEEWRFYERSQIILKKYFEVWKIGAVKKRQRRELIQETPIWMVNSPLNEIVFKLAHSCQNENLELMERYKLGVPKNFNLSLPRTFTKINLFSLIQRELRNFDCKKNVCGLLQQRKYYKFLLSTPKDNEEIPGFDSYLNRFLENSIEHQRNSKGFISDSFNNISICLRKVSGILPVNENNERVTNECDHSTSLIFIMTTEKKFEPSRKRLHHLLKLSRIFMKIPIVIIVYGPSHTTNMHSNSAIEYALEINNLIENNQIACMKLIKTDDEHLFESLEIGLKFLIRNSDEINSSSDLEMQSLTTFLNYSLADGIWQKFRSTLLGNPSFRRFCNNPNNVIGLYNEAIDRIINLIDDDFDEHPEFPKELREFVQQSILDIPQSLEYFPDDWKNYEKRSKTIITFLKKIKLKMLNFQNSLNIEEIEKYIVDYSKTCIPYAESSYRVAAYTAIKMLLENLNKAELLQLPVDERLNYISWLEIIRPIAFELLKSEWKLNEQNLPMEIIYSKKLFNDFNEYPWWLEEDRVKEIKFEQETNLDHPLLGNSNSEDFELIDSILNKSQTILQKANQNISKFYNLQEKNREITRDLDISLYEYNIKRKLKTVSDNTTLEIETTAPCMKKSKITLTKHNDEDDVIAKALSVIQKVEKRMDIRRKCEEKFLQLH